MEVGESLFSATERETLDSFLADIEGDALDRPFFQHGASLYGKERGSSSEGSGQGAWGQSGMDAGPSQRSGGGATAGGGSESPYSYPLGLSPSVMSADAPSPFWHPSPSYAVPPPPHPASSPARWQSLPQPNGALQPAMAEHRNGRSTSKRRRMDSTGEAGEPPLSGKGKGRALPDRPQPPLANGSQQDRRRQADPGQADDSNTSLLSLGSTGPSRPSSSAPAPATAPEHPLPPSQHQRGQSAAQRTSTESFQASRPGPSSFKRSKKPAAASTSPSASTTGLPPLLTAAQKKANHIASEQKRRANIKRGHDQLCEIVPALREAIAEAERKERGGVGAAKKKKKPKKGKGARKDDDAADEKVDGRAGPKSEGTVLLKTIDHIRTLQARRLALLSRLTTARAHARNQHNPADHEALGIAADQGVAWEDDWDGDVMASGSEDDG